MGREWFSHELSGWYMSRRTIDGKREGFLSMRKGPLSSVGQMGLSPSFIVPRCDVVERRGAAGCVADFSLVPRVTDYAVKRRCRDEEVICPPSCRSPCPFINTMPCTPPPLTLRRSGMPELRSFCVIEGSRLPSSFKIYPYLPCNQLDDTAYTDDKPNF